jgi:small subunit ribosomal protein S7
MLFFNKNFINNLILLKSVRHFSVNEKILPVLNESNNSLTLDSETFFLSSLIFKKFISQIMKDGKKFKSEKILKKILVGISLKGYSPMSTVIMAVNNVKPIVDVRTVRRRGKKFRVPFPLKNSRQITKSIQTLLRVSKNKIFFEKFLIEELINSAIGRSRSIKATLRLHKFAFQNRSFSNYRWF